MPAITSDFKRGSEWRRWDLQVHSPFSELNNGFGPDFDNYARALLQEAVARGITAIGITDYFSIEGFKQVKALLSDGPRLTALVGDAVAEKARHILFLPNIEFRSSIIVTRPGLPDGRVNFHIIFSDKVDTGLIEEAFLREVKFTAESEPSSPDNRLALTVANLAATGRRLKAQHTPFQDKSDLQVGMMNAVVAHEDVTDVLERQKLRFGDRALMAVAADEDLSHCSWNGQAHLAQKLMIQKSHMLFSANPGTRDFALGKKHRRVADFLREFRTLKPCVAGSDAHSNAELFEPAQERYLWIKADPTFDGLRQIMNEPEDRVFIGVRPTSMANVESRRTKTISAVTITKVQDSALTEKWFDTTVELNPQLTAIIGNKGSGKSALADVLGLLGNTPRQSYFTFLNPERFRDPRRNKARNFEASLLWADGATEGPTGLDQDPAETSVEKVKYIPQDYLEKTCNEVEIGKGSRFYNELQQVIFSHVPEADRLGFHTLDDLIESRTLEVDAAVSHIISELKDIDRTIASHEHRLTPQFRDNLMRQLTEKRRELTAHEGLKPTEVVRPDEDPAAQAESVHAASAIETKQAALRDIEAAIIAAGARDAALARNLAAADRLVGRLGNLRRHVDGVMTESAADITELGVRASDLVSLTINAAPVEALRRTLRDERAGITLQLDPSGVGSLSGTRVALSAEIESLRGSLARPQRLFAEYQRNLNAWQVARDRIVGAADQQGSIAQLETSLAELSDLPRTLQRLLKARRRKTLEIYREKLRLRDHYMTYYGPVQRFLSEHPVASVDALSISFDVAVMQSGFGSEFLARINQRRSGAFAGIEQGGAEVKKLLDATNWNSPLSVLRFSESVIQRLKAGTSSPWDITGLLKQGTAQELYDYVFSLGYLSPVFRLAWQGKGLEQLSPGERGNMLLIFYLLADRDNAPLVIDQPEENLDNQTVVRTLVPCMKDAKARRQIIMVTHNPNLAVVCDAEQIICADIAKDRANEVNYVGGSIENPVINKKIVDILEGTRPAFDLRDSKYYLASDLES